MTKSRLILLLSVILQFATANAGDGSSVGNGGGSSEQTLVYAYQNFDSLVEPCLRTDICHLGRDEKQLLLEIDQTLTKETPLEFLNIKTLKTLVFKTEENVGAPIQINAALLWKADSSGIDVSYSIEDSLELLTRALALHHP